MGREPLSRRELARRMRPRVGMGAGVAALLIGLAGPALAAAPASLRPPALGMGAGGTRELGSSVAISQAIAVIGAPGSDNFAGAAYLYAHSASGWHRQLVLADPTGTSNDLFGVSVAVSSSASATTAVIGAYGVNQSAGAAYIYARVAGQWHRQAALTDPGGVNGDRFGSSVAVSGEIAVIGAPDTNGDGGVVYVYARSGGTWSLQATLTDPVAGNNLFGRAVAVSGTTIAIGSPTAFYGHGGGAYVYARVGGTWQRQVTLRDPRGSTADEFGSSVAISGETAVIGAPDVSASPGLAYVYARSGQTWRLQAKLTRAHTSNLFGASVAISGDRALTSDPGSLACGRVLEYTRSGSTWRLRVTVVPPRCVNGGDEFGLSVALSGKTAVFGAPFANNEAGAVYIQTLP